MHFEALPSEMVTHIFLSLPDVSSALSLGATCHYFHHILHSSKRLLILSEAAEAEFGPISDIVQLVTHNRSQPAHIKRPVPMSDALLTQILSVGRVANRWDQIYPNKKWKTDYANRRLLSSFERYTFRRALYRLWLYTQAYHNASYTRTTRRHPQIQQERALLLQSWSTSSLAEMLDVHHVIRDTIANNICPSNGKIRAKFHKRHPDSTSSNGLLFNIHLNYPPASSPFVPDGWFHNSSIASSKYQSRLLNNSGRFSSDSTWSQEGWGDDINHYYIVEDMMKLSPEQLLFLRDRLPWKAQVEAYVRELGDWFGNNGETFSETVGMVLRGRGIEMEAVNAAIEEGELGVVLVDDY